MNNTIVGIVGCLNYVSEAEKLNKSAPIDTDFKRCETDRVTKVQRVSKLNALKERDEEVVPKGYFKTEVVTDEKGAKSVILMSNHYTYRQINLEGEGQKPDLSCTNPAKIKAAYFNDL